LILGQQQGLAPLVDGPLDQPDEEAEGPALFLPGPFDAKIQQGNPLAGAGLGPDTGGIGPIDPLFQALLARVPFHEILETAAFLGPRLALVVLQEQRSCRVEATVAARQHRLLRRPGGINYGRTEHLGGSPLAMLPRVMWGTMPPKCSPFLFFFSR